MITIATSATEYRNLLTLSLRTFIAHPDRRRYRYEEHVQEDSATMRRLLDLVHDDRFGEALALLDAERLHNFREEDLLRAYLGNAASLLASEKAAAR